MKETYFRIVIRYGVFSIIAIALCGCCISYNSLTNGTAYPVGSIIQVDGEQISVEEFQYSNGSWTSNGKAKIDNRNYSGGSGLDIGAGNTNLHFLFEYPVKKITLRFGDYGGNSNIRVNGVLKNLNSFPDVHGWNPDGVTVTVNAQQQGGNWLGKLILEGAIKDFSVGGQEFWIDEICHTK